MEISARTDIQFRKGYQQQFTDKFFLIKFVSKSFDTNQPVTYILKDKNGAKTLARFYESELVSYKYADDRSWPRHQVAIN